MTDEDFTTDDLYNEFEKYITETVGDDGVEPGTITRPEVCQAFSVSRTKAKAILDRMIEAGVLEKAKVRRHDGWRSALVNGYRLVK